MWRRDGFAYLKLSEGCGRRCTYCIIPKLRGRQKSRPLEDIVSEATALVETGVRELVLISQETSAYGRDLTPMTDLTELLGVLSARFPETWVRLLYMHPETITSGLIRMIADRENICSYFDIPVQHAADRILKRMGRHHTRAELFRLFTQIRNHVPQAALRTTVMVGFPGETEPDMDGLMNFIKEIEFDHVGVFVYSDHEDLASHGLAGHVALEKAEKRRHQLMTAQAEISRARNHQRLGGNIRVLLENRIGDHLFDGRAEFQAPEVDGIIRVGGDAPVNCGDFVTVHVTEATEYDLSGKIV
jgi:ribosomal protein S12 methylthiotransferase